METVTDYDTIVGMRSMLKSLAKDLKNKSISRSEAAKKIEEMLLPD